MLKRGTVSILNLSEDIRYLQNDLTVYIQNRFRPRYYSFRSLPKLKVLSTKENLVQNGAQTSLINFKTRTIFINVRPELPAARQWEEALGDTVHENLHDVFDLFPKDEKWNPTKTRLMNILMDGRNEQYASFQDEFAKELLQKMRQHAFIELEQTVPRKLWFRGCEPLWASAYFSLKIHTGLLARFPEIIDDFQSGRITGKEFWRRTKKALKLRKPPAFIKWKEAWRLVCRFWLSHNIYEKSKIVDEFLELYPKPAEKVPSKTSAEDRNQHQGVPVESDPEISEADGASGGGGGDGASEDGEQSVADCSGDSSSEKEAAGENGNQFSDHAGTEGDSAETPDSAKLDEAGAEDSTRPVPNSIPPPKPARSGKDVAEDLRQEQQSSSAGSPVACGGTIYPTDGRFLADQAKILAPRLKRELMNLTAPKKTELTVSSNRIRMPKVLKNPLTRDPWKKKKEISIDRNVVGIRIIGDTSGSIATGGKLTAMQLALAVFHEACNGNTEIDYQISTSVGFQIVATSKIKKSRGFNLLAGLATFAGDDFYQTLPLLFKEIGKEGKEIVFVFTDGQPFGIPFLAEIIGKARKAGTVVFGVGLNITDESDRLGMKELFGDDLLLCEITENNAERFTVEMSTVLRNLVRRRLFIN